MDLLQILTWLVPSGTVGVVAGWFASKTLRSARTAKEVHDTYHKLYNDVSETLIQIQNDNKELIKAVRLLNRKMERATRCRHYYQCPLRDELSKSEGISAKGKQTGQPRTKKNARADPDACGSELRESTGQRG